MQSVSEFLEEQTIEILRHKPFFEACLNKVKDSMKDSGNMIHKYQGSLGQLESHLDLLFSRKRDHKYVQEVPVYGQFPESAATMIDKSIAYAGFFRKHKEPDLIRVLTQDDHLRWMQFDMKLFRNYRMATIKYLFELDYYAQNNDLSLDVYGFDQKKIETIDYASCNQSLSMVSFRKGRGQGIESTFVDEDEFKRELLESTTRHKLMDSFNKHDPSKDSDLSEAYLFEIKNAMQDLLTCYMMSSGSF